MFKVVVFYATGHQDETAHATYEEARAHVLSLLHASQPGEWGFKEYDPPRQTDNGRLRAWVDITPPGCVESSAYIFAE